MKSGIEMKIQKYHIEFQLSVYTPVEFPGFQSRQRLQEQLKSCGYTQIHVDILLYCTSISTFFLVYPHSVEISEYIHILFSISTFCSDLRMWILSSSLLLSSSLQLSLAPSSSLQLPLALSPLKLPLVSLFQAICNGLFFYDRLLSSLS